MADSRIGLRKTQDKPGTVVVPERKYSREKKDARMSNGPRSKPERAPMPKDGKI